MENTDRLIMSNEEAKNHSITIDEKTDEQSIKFNVVSDRMNFIIQDKETGERMCVISGYDLNIDFNMGALKSVEDIESCVGGIAEMFRGIIVDLLLNKNA